MTTPQTVKTLYVQPKDVKFAYRKLGKAGGVPLLILPHFRASMDLWDPLFVSLLAAKREVILFDNAGIGQSSGNNPDSIKGMAENVVDFLHALKISQVDVYGFSMGGFIAQQLALDHPDLTHKIVLSGTGPGVGSEDGNVATPNDAKVGELATLPAPDFEGMHTLFFYPSETSKAAAKKWWARINERSKDTSGEERTTFVQGTEIVAQGTALYKWNHGEGKIVIAT
jgi:pimeloyl-ACP methyl ester carboxylesterase